MIIGYTFTVNMLIKSLLLTLLMTGVNPPALRHPLHVSVTEIEYDEKEKELEITMRVFVSDLETEIRLEKKQPELDILQPEGATTTEQIVGDYLRNHFNVWLDGKQQQTISLGQESDGDALVCYVLVKNVKKWKTIEVYNNIIMTTYDDQSNLVHVTVKNEVKSARLTSENPKAKFIF